MASAEIEYQNVTAPDDKDPSEYTYKERRAELFEAIVAVGDPRRLKQNSLAERYGVHQSTISRDIREIEDLTVAEVAETKMADLLPYVVQNARTAPSKAVEAVAKKCDDTEVLDGLPNDAVEVSGGGPDDSDVTPDDIRVPDPDIPPEAVGEPPEHTPRIDRFKDRSRTLARDAFWDTHDITAYMCPDCGRGYETVTEFHVHHRDGNALNNHPDNLIGLCVVCHRLREDKKPSLAALRNFRDTLTGGGADA